jgi:hypothetical protein
MLTPTPAPPTTPDLRVWGLTRRPRPRPFSSKVQVSAWTESEDGKTIYIVGIEAGGREYELQKRFSDFNKLYDRVSGSCRGIEFPTDSKFAFGKLSEAKIEKRRVELNKFIQVRAAHHRPPPLRSLARDVLQAVTQRLEKQDPSAHLDEL